MSVPALSSAAALVHGIWEDHFNDACQAHQETRLPGCHKTVMNEIRAQHAVVGSGLPSGPVNGMRVNRPEAVNWSTMAVDAELVEAAISLARNRFGPAVDAHRLGRWRCGLPMGQFRPASLLTPQTRRRPSATRPGPSARPQARRPGGGVGVRDRRSVRTCRAVDPGFVRRVPGTPVRPRPGGRGGRAGEFAVDPLPARSNRDLPAMPASIWGWAVSRL